MPSKDRVLWLKKKYLGNECKAILGLPSGNHILSIATNQSHDTHQTKLSHLILWP